MPTRDASSPARVALTSNGAGTSTATTAAFSTPPNSLLVVSLSLDTSVAANPSFTPPTGGAGLVWKRWSRGDSAVINPAGGSVCAFWAYSASAQTNITITSGATGIGGIGAGNAGAMWVDVWTGAAPEQGDAAAAALISTATPGNPSVSTTRGGSRVASIHFDFNNATAPTSTDTIDAYAQAGIGSGGRAYKASDTVAPGAVSVNFVPAASPQNSFVVYEILAALTDAWNTTGTGPRSTPLAGAGPIGAGTVGAFTRSTDAGGGGTIEGRTLTSAGIGAATWVSASTEGRTLTSVGVGAATFQAAAINVRTLSAAGAGAANWQAASILARTFTAPGAAAVTWQAVQIESRTLASSGAGAATWSSASVEGRTFTAPGAGAATWSGIDASGGATIEARTFSAAGIGAASFVAASIEGRTLAASGAGAATWASAQIESRLLAASGASVVAFQAAEIAPRTLGVAGTAAVSWLGTDANVATIESRTFSADGAATVSWLAVDANKKGGDGGTKGKKKASGSALKARLLREFEDEQAQQAAKAALPRLTASQKTAVKRAAQTIAALPEVTAETVEQIVAEALPVSVELDESHLEWLVYLMRLQAHAMRKRAEQDEDDEDVLLLL